MTRVTNVAAPARTAGFYSLFTNPGPAAVAYVRSRIPFHARTPRLRQSPDVHV